MTKTRIMVFGSTSIRRLPGEAMVALDRIMALGYEILISDSLGVDYQVQRYLRSKGYPNVKVYYSKWKRKKARYAHGYPTIPVDGKKMSVDVYMRLMVNNDLGLAIWDGKSPGTKATIDALKRCQVIQVYAAPRFSHSRC